MEQINVLGWILQVDKKATTSNYESADTDLCDCAYCNNYVTALPEHFPKGFLEILQNIGIDPLKPSHISEVCADIDKNHLYVGNYDFVGNVLKKPDGQQMETQFSIDIIGWTPKLNIQFSITIPWVLSEEIESIPCPDRKT